MTEPLAPPTSGRAEERVDTDFVQSLQRGLAVIRAFDAEHPTFTLSEVARATGLARAAARRFLLTLVELGYGAEEVSGALRDLPTDDDPAVLLKHALQRLAVG